MSELLQSGQHPDADQLSAFVEHVLPAHEQEETLAHLAVCSACRSIVALSLPPVEEEPIPQPARRPWLSGWNLVWSGTAALAAMVLVGVLLRNDSSVRSRVRSHVPPAQTALASPPPPPPVLHQLLPGSAGRLNNTCVRRGGTDFRLSLRCPRRPANGEDCSPKHARPRSSAGDP
jgi:hypothetical protein